MKDKSKKFEEFMMALQTLMREHDVMIYPSVFNAFCVWDFCPFDEAEMMKRYTDMTNIRPH